LDALLMSARTFNREQAMTPILVVVEFWRMGR